MMVWNLKDKYITNMNMVFFLKEQLVKGEMIST